MKLRWRHKQSINIRHIEKRLCQLLLQTGSLSHYLQQKNRGIFNIEIKAQSWCLPMPDEKKRLRLKNGVFAFVRQSWLKSNNSKMVYARTVIPKSSLTGKTSRLVHLGNQPLGDILFADKTTYRASIRYAKIIKGVAWYPFIANEVHNDEDIWARQSLFFIQKKPLLISEIFLPSILRCIDA